MSGRSSFEEHSRSFEPRPPLVYLYATCPCTVFSTNFPYIPFLCGRYWLFTMLRTLFLMIDKHSQTTFPFTSKLSRNFLNSITFLPCKPLNRNMPLRGRVQKNKSTSGRGGKRNRALSKGPRAGRRKTSTLRVPRPATESTTPTPTPQSSPSRRHSTR